MTKIRDGEAKKRGKVQQSLTEVAPAEIKGRGHKPLNVELDPMAVQVKAEPIKPVVKITAPKKPRTPKAPK